MLVIFSQCLAAIFCSLFHVSGTPFCLSCVRWLFLYLCCHSDTTVRTIFIASFTRSLAARLNETSAEKEHSEDKSFCNNRNVEMLYFVLCRKFVWFANLLPFVIIIFCWLFVRGPALESNECYVLPARRVIFIEQFRFHSKNNYSIFRQCAVAVSFSCHNHFVSLRFSHLALN